MLVGMRRAVLSCAIGLFGCGSEAPKQATSAPVSSVAAAPSSSSPVASASAPAPAAKPQGPRTPNEFFARGKPTFITGTAGDDFSDKVIAGQVELVRGQLFPASQVVADSSIDFKKGPSAWPENPVVYGGPHVNALVAAIAPQLPFQMAAGSLVIGRDKLGDDLVLITVVPGRAADESGPGYPTFLLYAGTRTPGVSEINAFKHGGEAIYVGDAFGLFINGEWIVDPKGKTVPRLLQSYEREDIEHTSPEIETLKGSKGEAPIEFYALRAKPGDDDKPSQAAVMRGLATAVKKLRIEKPRKMQVFLYPDHALKQKLTGKSGDGHAVQAAHAIHVVRVDPKPNGPLERLIAHEGTHILVNDEWGVPGTALAGEGLAVWVAGTYQGTTLEEWRTKLKDRPPIRDLITKQFFKLPEATTYPRSGLFMSAAISELGFEKAKSLYFAGALGFEDACVKAGTTVDKLDERTK
jgi:hypothetical protein